MSSDGRRTVHTKAGLRARQPTQTGEHMSISYLPVSNTNVPGRQPIAQLEATFTAKLAELRALRFPRARVVLWQMESWNVRP
jgi:hypothetical protein